MTTEKNQIAYLEISNLLVKRLTRVKIREGDVNCRLHHSTNKQKFNVYIP